MELRGCKLKIEKDVNSRERKIDFRHTNILHLFIIATKRTVFSVAVLFIESFV